MRNPTKTFLSFTWVGWLNLLLLQWACIRLGYGEHWGFIFPIVPMTGWWTPYLPRQYRQFSWKSEAN